MARLLPDFIGQPGRNGPFCGWQEIGRWETWLDYHNVSADMIKWAGQKICIWKKYWWLCFGRGNIRTTLQFKAATEEMRGGDETQILLSKTYIDRVSHTVCQWDQIPPRIICTYRWNQRAPWQSPPAISFLNEHLTSFCCIRVNVHKCVIANFKLIIWSKRNFKETLSWYIGQY